MLYSVSARGRGFVMLALAAGALMGPPAHGASQALGVKHPVLDYQIDPAKVAVYEGAVARVMAMNEEEMLAFVAEQPPCVFCECPNCYGGVQGHNIYEYDSGTPPFQLKCRFCGEVVFPNDQYPEDQVLAGQNALGETVTYKYYQNPVTGVRHFLSAHLDHQREMWIVARCLELGKAYQATGASEYARRVALILDRKARLYPHYPVMRTWIRKFEFAESQQPPYPADGGRLDRWIAGEMPGQIVNCYDLVCESDPFDKLAQERGYDVREKIETDLFRAAFDSVNVPPLRILDGGALSTRNLRRALIMGRVLNEPRYFHWAFEWLKAALFARCFYDGMLHLGPSYHYQIMGDFKSAFEIAKGYSDPSGWQNPVDGTRYDNLDPARDIPFFARALHAPEILDFPNGFSTPVHDTWANEKRSQPRQRTVSTLAPGFGHASLGRGENEHQMQAQLHFSGSYGHSHLDNLNLTVWAKGEEMVSDLGYTWTRLRAWTSSTAGHNTVVVDRRDQVGRLSDGDLLWFFPDTGGVASVAADGKRGYGNIVGLDLYQRVLALIAVDSASAYVLDIFRVRGGAIHDWLLHGDANRDMAADWNLIPTGTRDTLLEPGEEWAEPQQQGSRFNPYGMMRDLRQAPITAAGALVTFTYEKNREKGLRIHLLGGPETEAFLGRSPSVRRAGAGARADDKKVYDFWMPQLVVRRTRAAGVEPPPAAALHSVFVAVQEPFDGKPVVDSVRPVALDPPDPDAVALRVRHAAGIDTIILTLDQPPYTRRTTPDGISLEGRLGIVRHSAGRISGMWLFDGTALMAGADRTLRAQTRAAGNIVAATRRADGAADDSFLTDTDLPAGDTLHGVWMIVTHGNGFTRGYEIDRVEKREGKTAIVLTADHGLHIADDTTREVYYPQREIAGRNTFAIPSAAMWAP